MSLVLNTNISSLVAQNNLTSSGAKLATSLQQLSSGLRINTAADDAAGYAIVQGMTSQINGIGQAARNANDGVSLSQTASGALQEVTNDLQTMRDLAVQSLNATNSTSDRADLDAQFQQLKADINSVASQTQFNGVNLLDGSFQGATFQVGANAGQSITMTSISSSAATNLGNLYTQAATAPAAYTNSGAAASATNLAVANGDGGSFSISAGGKTYTTAGVTLTGSQATDLKTVAAAINQATGAAGIVATVNTAGTGLDVSSTTAQTVGVSYSATTGAATGATFGLAASNVLVPATGFNSGAGATVTAATVTAALTTATADTGTFSVTIGGTAYTTGAVALTGVQATDLTSIAGAINTAIAGHGVTASVNGTGGISFASTTSQTVTTSATFAGAGTLGAAQGTETAATYGLAGSNSVTTANTNTSTSGFLDTADVKTVDDSNKVLLQIDAALQQLATTGAQLGAYQNRFQAAVTGLNTDSTNLTSARSQIQDTDYASATSALSKAQILQQASTAMVSQANTIPQNILSLLQKLP